MKKHLNEIYKNADVDSYEPLRFTLPIWHGEICFCEMVFIHESDAKGSIDDIKLLYDATEIISVRDNTLQILYTEGKDYELTSDGRLKILEDGSIKRMTYHTYYSDEKYEGYHLDRSDKTQSHYYFSGDTYCPTTMSTYSINVTYRHGKASPVTIPKNQSDRMKRFIDKVARKENVSIVSIGDSITKGWSSSSNANQLPNIPSYTYLFCEYIEKAYGIGVEHTNLGVAGELSYNAYTKKATETKTKIEQALEKNPDLVILAYGMNDGDARPSDAFITSINNALDLLRNPEKGGIADLPVLVVGTCMPNHKTHKGGDPTRVWLNFQKDYIPALWTALDTWGDGIVLADVGSVHIDIMKRKEYEDTAGSNTNHPNDYLHRVYAQVLIQTVFGEFKPWNLNK